MNESEIGVCDDKGEANIKIRIKIDWKAERYWVKYFMVDHKEV